MLTHFVKVKVGKMEIFLVDAKYVTRGTHVFLSGYQVDKSGDKVGQKGDVLHLIEVGSSTTGSLPMFTPSSEVTIHACEMNNFYVYPEIEVKGRIQ